MPRSDEQRSPHLLALARRHPGWGCRRIWAAMLERHGVTVSKSAVANWVRDAGLAPANRRLRPGDWPRREAVAGTCGHPVAPPPVDEPDRLVLCFECGWVDVRRDVSHAHVLELSRRPLPQPDTAPTAPESALHFVDRDALAVARDLLDRIRYGTSTPVLARVGLRRLGWTDEEIDKTLGPSSRSRSRRR
jgi:hypothetical protein